MSSSATSPNPQRVSITRHDLRNPLGEIQGFAEILAEEAAEQGFDALIPEFNALAQAASGLLQELNESLTVEHLAGHAQATGELESGILGFSQHVLEAVAGLAARCGALAERPFLDDLVRIGESAARLAERAPALLADLFREPDVEGGFITGETIYFRKPAGPTGEPAQDTGYYVRTGERRPLTGTVLVVDDTESNRALLTRRLGREGFTTVVADGGRVALDLMRRHAFDVVLLDIMMPGMNGHDVLTAMRADPELRHLPVIMISGLDDLDTLVRCIEGGAEDYLTKPFDPVLLRARIGACLEKKQLRDRERRHLAQIDEQRRRADELLHVILPQSIAAELKEHNRVKPRHHPNVAVLFSDVTGFTSYCDKHPPEVVIENLQALVSRFEDIAERHGLEKIKTIGDAFMATAGLLDEVANPVRSCVRAGLEMCAAAERLPAGWRVHVGVHVGPVIAGVVGARKFHFDVWGDTVNTAARVAGLAGESGLVLSERAWRDVEAVCTGRSAGRFQVKGKGELQVFRVTGA